MHEPRTVRRGNSYRRALNGEAFAWLGGAMRQVFLGDLFPGIISSGGFTASAIPLR